MQISLESCPGVGKTTAVEKIRLRLYNQLVKSMGNNFILMFGSDGKEFSAKDYEEYTINQNTGLRVVKLGGDPSEDSHGGDELIMKGYKQDESAIYNIYMLELKKRCLPWAMRFPTDLSSQESLLQRKYTVDLNNNSAPLLIDVVQRTAQSATAIWNAVGYFSSTFDSELIDIFPEIKKQYSYIYPENYITPHIKANIKMGDVIQSAWGYDCKRVCIIYMRMNCTDFYERIQNRGRIPEAQTKKGEGFTKNTAWFCHAAHDKCFKKYIPKERSTTDVIIEDNEFMKNILDHHVLPISDVYTSIPHVDVVTYNMEEYDGTDKIEDFCIELCDKIVQKSQEMFPLVSKNNDESFVDMDIENMSGLVAKNLLSVVQKHMTKKSDYNILDKDLCRRVKEISDMCSNPMFTGSTTQDKDLKIGKKFGHVPAFGVIPGGLPEIQECTDSMHAQHWSSTRFDPEKDKEDFMNLPKEERYALENVITFFAGFENVILDPIINIFCPLFGDETISGAFRVQVGQENIHDEIYRKYIKCFMGYDKDELNERLQASMNDTKYRKMFVLFDWIRDKYRVTGDDGIDVVRFCLAQYICEILFLSSIFPFVMKYSMGVGKDNRIILNEFVQMNRDVQRDENIHGKLQSSLLRRLKKCDKVMKNWTDNSIRHFIIEATEIAIEFGHSMFMPGTESVEYITKDQLTLHIKSTCNMMCETLDIDPPYVDTETGKPIRTPLNFLKNTTIHVRTNFFEKQAQEYSRDKRGIDMSDKQVSMIKETLDSINHWTGTKYDNSFLFSHMKTKK